MKIDKWTKIAGDIQAGMGDTIGIGITDRYFGLRYQVSVSVSMNLKLRY